MQSRTFAKQTAQFRSAKRATFSKGVLFHEGIYYLIGEGHKEFISDKWQDSDFYLFTLMGIARELNREGITSARVQLAAGIPLTLDIQEIRMCADAVSGASCAAF